jgi:hypothetical protein
MAGLTSRPTEGRSGWRRRFSFGLVGVTVALAGMVAVSSPAHAAPGTVTGATFEWTFSDEANAASFNGQCNFWSAGQSDGTLATYTATNGNATVLKLDATNTYVPISDFATRCLDKNGTPANFFNGPVPAPVRLGQKVRFTGGSGTLDPATGASTIQWTGTWSINFYGDNVPFWMTNPKLTMNASGNGTITATMGGYKSDINDPSIRIPLPAVPNVVIATLAGVSAANATGFSTTPVYGGVQYDADPVYGQSPQNRTSPGWGSWPDSFVDFQMETGLGSYWYTSGSASIDIRKPPQSLTVGYGTFAPAPTPTTSVSPNANLNPFVGNSLTITGAGFTGFSPSQQGVYVGLASSADWQPGQVPNIADIIGADFVPKAAIVGGNFTKAISVPANVVNLAETYGVVTFCAHGCSITPAPSPDRAFDTFTPVTFAVTTDPALAKVGSGFSYQVTPFAGVAPYSYAVVGAVALPTGLSLDSSTGVISGTPTTESVAKVKVQVSDAKTPTPRKVTTTLSFRVAPAAMGFGPTVLPSGKLLHTYTDTQLAGSGGVGPYKFKVTTGVLPEGVRLTGTGLLKGKPRVTGSFPITVTMTDTLKFTSTRSYTLHVLVPDPLVITTETVPAGQRNVAYPVTPLTATGGVAPHKFTVAPGTLPRGMSISYGELQGTPRESGSFPITVTVTDKLGVTATHDYVVEVT